MARRAKAMFLIIVLLLTTLSALPMEALGLPGPEDLDRARIKADLDRLPSVRSGAFRADTGPGADMPWWLTTAMDADRDSIFDTLEDWLGQGRPAAIFVDFDHEPGRSDVQMVEALGVEVAGTYGIVDAIGVLSATPDQVRRIAGLPGVVMVEPSGNPVLYMDIAIPAAKARGSDLYSPLTAWESGYSGKGIVITVMDTGQDNEHPALTGKWVGGADISKPETPWWPRDGTFNADDTNGHGTTCAGIATSTGAPDGKYMGAAPDAHLVDLRIGTKLGYAPGEGPGNFYDATIQALDWAVQFADEEWAGADPEYHGMDVLSLSWGNDVGGSSDGKDVYSRAVDALATKTKVIPVIAAGNAGPNNDGFDGLGAADLAITIAATDDKNTIDRADDIIADYSSRGPRKDDGDDNPYEELKPNLAAPGTNIMGVQYDQFGDGSGNGYGSRGSGTSYATPLVSGVVALLLEANPDLTLELVREILQFTAERRGEPTYPELDPFWNRDFGWGIIDAYNATRVAANITNVSAIDTGLQAFIMNITETGNAFVLEGIAWNRFGVVDNVEVSLDGSPWRTAKDEANDSWLKWTYEVPKAGLDIGNHTVKVRAVAGDKQSLEDQRTFYSPRTYGPKTVAIGGGMIGLAVVFVAAAAVVVYLVKTKRLARMFKR